MRTIRATFVLALAATPLAAQQWQIGTEITGRSFPAVAYDAVRAELVLFGGITYTAVSDETWLHDGSDWRLAAPANRPPARQQAAFAHDIVRGRSVLFGGQLANGSLAGDTWEWDGSTWVQILTANAPSPRRSSALAFDVANARAVLFGGYAGSASFADTWTYDGTNWTHLFPANTPPGRLEHALAYDSSRARTVLFGEGPAPAAHTWEFDGVNWTQVITPVAPPWRRSHGMTFDVARGRVVVFGGIGPGNMPNYTDTWEYDGVTWTQRAPAHTPGPQGFARLAYDHAHQRTVLFGGANAPGEQANTHYWDGTDWSDHSQPAARDLTAFADDTLRGRTIMFGGSNSTVLRDTWEHDGARWTRVATANGPLQLAGAALAFDPQRARTILFGGIFLSATYDQTWEYDGVAWTVRQLAVRPQARRNHAMAYDRARRRVVLFGGETGGNPSSYRNDTWEYDGNGWSPITPMSILPAARTRTAIVFEASRGRVLMFGGTNNVGWPGFSDTWAWNGVGWLQLAPNGVPQARYGHGLAHDALRGRTLLFGGARSTSQSIADAWEFDGEDWTPVVASPAPSARSCALVFQQHTGRTLSFGGGVGTSTFVSLFSGPTTFFVPAAAPTFTRYGRGCAGSAGVPELDTVPPALPALGASFPLRLGGLPATPGFAAITFGFDLVRWNGQALPVGLGMLGLPGCDAWIAPAPGLAVLVPYAGTATHSLALPASPALAGLVLGAQAVVFDTAAPSGLGAVSNAAILRIH